MNEPKALETKITGIDTETLDGGRSQSPIVNQSPKRNVVNTITVDEVKEAVDKKQIDPKLLGTRWFLHTISFKISYQTTIGGTTTNESQSFSFISTYGKPLTSNHELFYLCQAYNFKNEHGGGFSIQIITDMYPCVFTRFAFMKDQGRCSSTRIFTSSNIFNFSLTSPGSNIGGFNYYKPRKINLETGEMEEPEQAYPVRSIVDHLFTDTVTEL